MISEMAARGSHLFFNLNVLCTPVEIIIRLLYESDVCFLYVLCTSLIRKRLIGVNIDVMSAGIQFAGE